MTDASYRQALADLKKEREKLTADRNEMDRRLSRIDAAIANLAVVVDDEPFDGTLTEAVRAVLKRVPGKPFMPTEVRDQLKEIGYDITQHTNIMASVHSVLKRLAETPDVTAVKSGVEGGWLYRWKGILPVTPRNPNSLASIQDAMKEVAKVTAAINSPSMQEQMAAIANAAGSGNMRAVSEALEEIKSANRHFEKLKAAGLFK